MKVWPTFFFIFFCGSFLLAPLSDWVLHKAPIQLRYLLDRTRNNWGKEIWWTLDSRSENSSRPFGWEIFKWPSETKKVKKFVNFMTRTNGRKRRENLFSEQGKNNFKKEKIAENTRGKRTKQPEERWHKSIDGGMKTWRKKIISKSNWTSQQSYATTAEKKFHNETRILLQTWSNTDFLPFSFNFHLFFPEKNEDRMLVSFISISTSHFCFIKFQSQVARSHIFYSDLNLLFSLPCYWQGNRGKIGWIESLHRKVGSSSLSSPEDIPVGI